MGSGTCTSARCGWVAFMRRWDGSSISWGGRFAAEVTTTKEGMTPKCYPSPEYKVSPITWTVQREADPLFTVMLPALTGPTGQCRKYKDEPHKNVRRDHQRMGEPCRRSEARHGQGCKERSEAADQRDLPGDVVTIRSRHRDPLRGRRRAGTLQSPGMNHNEHATAAKDDQRVEDPEWKLRCCRSEEHKSHRQRNRRNTNAQGLPTPQR